MKIGFLLGKDHKTLPLSELIALLEIYSLNGELTLLDNYGVLSHEGSIEKSELIDIVNNIVRRSAYINEGHIIIFQIEHSESLNKGLKLLTSRLLQFESKELLNLLNMDSSRDTFAIRVIKMNKRYSNENENISSMAIERIIGEIIRKKTNAKVNLKNPSKTIKIIISRDRIYVALLLEKRDKEYFNKNRPHLRAYFHPGCILPKLARGMVNLARLKENQILLDPFCGTGGFLIEGGFIGCKLIGCDIDENMINGTLLNLKSYKLENKIIDLKKINAQDVIPYLKSLGINEVDAIVTDPPYGISTSAKGSVEDIINNLGSILKNNGYMVFASFKKIYLENLKLKEIHELYIHKSLTRYIHIYKKE
ncbi:MAG TPA: TIGR01177 family methyltransferase [Methanothermococcus okinawensis]|uniref:tRNA (guanine(10)-N(2))-dimethyltransferase n=1 Tax=Methanothermococcus okinawensis TaxID=155863 RepID=A0A832YRP9_9EURY|nr:TIGR01177 family methyltransferase [Methanothermococcus okinawensis]